MTRKMILNEWTGTYHVHERCRGLTDSKAPRSVVEVKWADVPDLPTCGYCDPKPRVSVINLPERR